VPKHVKKKDIKVSKLPKGNKNVILSNVRSQYQEQQRKPSRLFVLQDIRRPICLLQAAAPLPRLRTS